MKNKLLVFVFFTAVICAKANAQAGVYLFIPGITTGAGTAGHADEVFLTSVKQGATIPVTYGSSGGGSVGRPTVTDVIFEKGFDRSSLRLQNALFRGSNTPFAEIRYYNGTGTGTLVYVIRVEDFYVNGYTSSNEACAAGCPGLTESISFSYSIIIFRNLVTTPNQVLTYDRVRGMTTFTQ